MRDNHPRLFLSDQPRPGATGPAGPAGARRPGASTGCEDCGHQHAGRCHTCQCQIPVHYLTPRAHGRQGRLGRNSWTLAEWLSPKRSEALASLMVGGWGFDPESIDGRRVAR
jgi:hypothetical protein